MLVKRIVLLFFRDKANVFFSLLAVLIILALYILFLGNMMEQALAASLGYESEKISVTIASLTLGGMVAVTSITGCMGALGISVSDKENAAKDFLSSPVSRNKLTLSYILGSTVVGFMMTIIALVICMVYIITNGESVPGAETALYLLLTVMLSVLCGNAMVYFLSIFVKTQNAFASVSTVLGTLIGFLMGIYIPIGQMPESVQWVIKCFPMSHAASMFRQLLADDLLSELFNHAPPGALDEFRDIFGVVFVYGDYSSGFWTSAAVLGLSAMVFFMLSIGLMRTKKLG